MSSANLVTEEQKPKLGTDEGSPLGEDPGPIGEPGQKLRLAVTSMGGYWRVDVFGEEGAYQTWDCKTSSELGSALANAYSVVRGTMP